MSNQRAVAWCEVCGLKKEFDLDIAMKIMLLHKRGVHDYLGEKE